MKTARLRSLIPNALSLLRIILAPLIFAVGGQPIPVFALIVACGLSDALDGYLARRWRVQSQLGARLDSLGDLVFFGAIAVWLLVWQSGLVREIWPWLALITAIRLAAAAVCRVRNNKLYSVHTLANKATGLAIVVAMGAFVLSGESAVVFAVMLVALASATEELLIFILVKAPDPDRKSLLVFGRGPGHGPGEGVAEGPAVPAGDEETGARGQAPLS